MAANQVQAPFVQIPDEDGSSLENGYVYIGTVDLNPISNPITTYWDVDLTIPAAQPIRTNNGFYSQNGSPGKIYVNASDYSITVKNKNQVIVYTSLNNSDVLSTVPSSSVTGQFDASRIDFEQTGTGFVSRTVEDKFQDIVSVKDFGALGDGSNDDTTEIQAALDSISAGRVHFPAGTYNITAPLQIRTTDMIVFGDSGGTIIKAVIGFSGTSAIVMEASSNCTLEDIVVDCDSLLDNGINVEDGSVVSINRVVVKNCDAIGFRIHNVNACVLTACGAETVDGAAFDFLASAALDAAATINGIECRLMDCYSSAAGVSNGTIYSDQVDTSSINVVIERFKEVTNSGSISVASNSVHTNHIITLIDCLFIDAITGIANVFTPANSIRTDGIAIIDTSYTPIVQINSQYGGSTEFTGFLLVTVSSFEISSGSGNLSLYTVTVNSVNSTVGVTANEPGSHFSFQLDTGTGQLECQADTVGDAGTYYFHITQLGGIGVTNV